MTKSENQRKLWGEGEYQIPVILDMDSIDENGMIAGMSKSDIHKKRVCNRQSKVAYVNGSKELYDEVMDTYYKEFKREDRAKRCSIGNGNGRLIRCPEIIVNPKTGEKVANNCENCPYYNSLDKQEYFTIPFSTLAHQNDDGDVTEFEPSVDKMENESERYIKMLEELIEHVKELDPVLAEVIRLREKGMGQTEIGQAIGKSQASVNAYLKKLKPIVDEFLEQLIY